MINPVWWHYRLSDVICLEKQNQSFLRVKMRFAKMSQNQYDQMCRILILTLMHPNNMNLRKQMAFRPFLQNVSKMHWQNERKRNKVRVCVQVILKEKTRISLSVSCYNLVVAGFLSKEPAYSRGYLEGGNCQFFVLMLPCLDLFRCL